MRVLLSIGVALAALALTGGGCGEEEAPGKAGEKPKGQPGMPDPYAKGQPDEKAALMASLDEYLRLGSMDMKSDRFESIEVTGDQAVAKVRMAMKDDTYGLKPTWTRTNEFVRGTPCFFPVDHGCHAQTRLGVLVESRSATGAMPPIGTRL